MAYPRHARVRWPLPTDARDDQVRHRTQVREFYLRGFDETGFKYDEAGYKAQVLDRAPGKVFQASLSWLVDGGAITQDQADRLDVIYEHRHDLTHELAKYLVDPAFEPDASLFGDALEILADIHRFWTQIEIDIGSFEEHGDVSTDDATPGVVLLMSLCIDAYVEGLRGDPDGPPPDQAEPHEAGGTSSQLSGRGMAQPTRNF